MHRACRRRSVTARRRRRSSTNDVGVRTLLAVDGRQRHDLVEKCRDPGDDARAPRRGRTDPGGASSPQRIGSVQRVVQRSPPGVGGVERVTRVRDRHDELRPGDRGDLGVATLSVSISNGGSGRAPGSRCLPERRGMPGVVRLASSFDDAICRWPPAALLGSRAVRRCEGRGRGSATTAPPEMLRIDAARWQRLGFNTAASSDSDEQVVPVRRRLVTQWSSAVMASHRRRAPASRRCRRCPSCAWPRRGSCRRRESAARCSR